MSDLVVVMGPDNRVHQMDSPLEIYRNPADTFVADFIGTSNLLQATCSGTDEVTVGDQILKIDDMAPEIHAGNDVTISVRPENIHIIPGIEEGLNRIHGQVGFVRDVGSSVEIYIDCNGLQITSQSTPKGRPPVKQGDDATVILPPEACVVLKS